MSDRGEPLYQTRPVAPEAARFGCCRRVNEFILLSEGNSNCYLIETAEGNILVNAGMGFEAPVHRANFDSLLAGACGRISYLILTQGHVDHLGGVQFFRNLNPALKVIAQAGNTEHQAYDKRLQAFRQARSAFRFVDSFTQVFQGYGKAGYSHIVPQDCPTPDLLFEKFHSLQLGGLQLELRAQPGAETNDSLMIWLPRQRICFTGNLFGCPFGHFPNLVTIRGDRYRDALTCMEAAQAVLDLSPQLILYGYHDPIEGAELIHREVTAIRDAIHYVHDETVKGMNAGKDVYSLMRTIRLPAECEVGQGYGMVSWGVRAIWEYYAGWFHHRSTTELYAQPRQVVDRDLVELAGAEALVARARQKFSDGESQSALHLLEMVLNVEPKHSGAQVLAVSVHQRLLGEAESFCHTGNFWLSGWLLHRIKQLGGEPDRSLSGILD